MLKFAIIRSNLSYHAFRKELIRFQAFSVRDVKKIFPNFDSKRLNEWQDKGYIEKLLNKRYLFTEVPKTELLQFRISNLLLQPSYVSLQSALSYYHFIPEGVYSTTAVSSVKTISYHTPVGTFKYQSFKPGFYFGYTIMRLDILPVLIAEPEKAILDYLYFSTAINRLEDLQAIRFNREAIEETIDWKKIELYAQVFGSATLSRRLRLFKKWQQHVTTQ